MALIRQPPVWALLISHLHENISSLVNVSALSRATLPENSGISSSHTMAQVLEGRVLPLNLMLQSSSEDRFNVEFVKLYRN